MVRHRRCDAPALKAVDAEPVVLHRDAHIVGLDPLGDHDEIERTAEIGDGLHDRPVVLGIGHRRDERTVDLERRHRQAAKA